MLSNSTEMELIMWYFAWILGTLLACCLAVITALAIEQQEKNQGKKSEEK